jgi:hypothetical protein
MIMIIYQLKMPNPKRKGGKVKGKAQKGGLSFSSVLNAASKVANVAQTAKSFVDTGKIQKKNPKLDYKPRAGENHQLFRAKDGFTYRAFYSGPGSQVQKQNKSLYKKAGNSVRKAISKDNFASELDLIAARHDNDYLLAEGDFKKVHAADKRMIDSIKKLKAKGTDPHPKFNITAPEAAIKAKYAAEGLKGSLIDKFIGKEPMSTNGKKLAERFRDRLGQAGYGVLKDRMMNMTPEENRQIWNQTKFITGSGVTKAEAEAFFHPKRDLAAEANFSRNFKNWRHDGSGLTSKNIDKVPGRGAEWGTKQYRKEARAAANINNLLGFGEPEDKVRPDREWKQTDIWTCPSCGSKIQHRSKSGHMKSKKHLDATKAQEGRGST